MPDAPKSDAMKAAEAKGMQTSPQGGKNPPPASTPTQSQQEARREASPPPRSNILSDAVRRQQQEQASTVPGSAVGHDANQGVDRVTASRSRDIAAAQGLAFNTGTLHDLQNIYGNLRDGNYFQAGRLAIAFLNDVLNPDPAAVAMGVPGRNVVRAGATRPPRAAMPMPHEPEGQQAYDDVCTKLEKWAQASAAQPHMFPSSERNVPAQLGVDQIGMLIQLILQLVGSFRGSTEAVYQRQQQEREQEFRQRQQQQK